MHREDPMNFSTTDSTKIVMQQREFRKSEMKRQNSNFGRKKEMSTDRDPTKVPKFAQKPKPAPWSRQVVLEAAKEFLKFILRAIRN